MSRSTTRPVATSRVGEAQSACVGPVLREGIARLRTARILTARQDAELLLAFVLGTTRLELHLEPGRAVPAAVLARFEALLARRVVQEPIQYLLGEVDFCGLRLAVGPGAFIPRPETELVVERGLAVVPAAGGSIVDLCTGSGAIACALAVRHPGLSVWAVEGSPEAAAWARDNVQRLGLGDRVRVLEGDLAAPLAGLELEARCDLVTANPPYMAQPVLATLPEEVRDFEPVAALDGGPDGTTVIAEIVRAAPAFLRPGGTLLVEIGHDQARRVCAQLAGDRRYGAPRMHRDFRGHERVLEVRRV